LLAAWWIAFLKRYALPEGEADSIFEKNAARRKCRTAKEIKTPARRAKSSGLPVWWWGRFATCQKNGRVANLPHARGALILRAGGPNAGQAARTSLKRQRRKTYLR
jgi:hypothetical protein